MPTEDIKETFKILTQQQDHEIDLWKKYVQNTLRRKANRFDIFKILLSLSVVEDERIVV